MNRVLDASALMAYLEKESGYEKVQKSFVKAAETGKNLLMTSVNWGEVYYVLARNYGIKKTERIQRVIDTFPVEIVSVDLTLAKQAAVYKATKKMPYMDCFAASLAKICKAELMTGDKEFKTLEDEIAILWI